MTTSNLLAAAVANAIGNALRKKGKPPQKLWKKKPVHGNIQERENDLQIAMDVQEQDGDSWIRKIYAANFSVPGGGEKR